MNEKFVLRSEDFRFTWANAYQLSILQVVELQIRTDRQLQLSHELLEAGAERTEYFRTSLRATVTVILEQLKMAGINSEARIKEATNTLIKRADSLYDREIRLREDTLKIKRQIQEDLTHLKRAKNIFYGQPLWKRLLQSFTGRD